jgi:hypothetical protein
MKKFALILTLFVMQTVIGQTKIVTTPTPLVDTLQSSNDCSTAFKICDSLKYDFKVRLDGGNCSFVQYLSNSSNAGSITISLSGFTANSSTQWILYGPFASNSSTLSLSVCDQINNYSSSYTNGVFVSNSQTLMLNANSLYVLKIITTSSNGTIKIVKGAGTNLNCNNTIDCSDCVKSFSPKAGKYILSAWVKDEGVSQVTSTEFTSGKIDVSFGNSTVVFSNLSPKGQIIDGWQRLEEEITIPASATSINIILKSIIGNSFFDDIRFHPIDGSMMSYVYDPNTLRLMAELDERNYATFYEYDEEGKLIRIKKETEKGIMTIQENRDNIKKL